VARTTPESLYAAHVRERRDKAAAALEASGFDVLVLSSGRPFTYFADDQDAPFHETPHFAHWVPLTGPHHVLALRRGERPRLVRVAPEDYWYEQAPLGQPFWAGEFELDEVATPELAWKHALDGLDLKRAAYVGDDPDGARSAGVPADGVLPAALVARLDWDRSYKTPYEVACLELAAESAARGHIAAKDAFEAGASELDIHHAYLRAAGTTEADLPYPTIIGHDEKGAILHYTGKRPRSTGRVLLIDAGTRHLGYASDVTRTWTRSGCDALFRRLVEGLDAIQRELCESVRPGLAYPDLHRQAHVRIGDLLQELGILRTGGEAAFEAGATRPFFPHGLGHFLGIQVHDVAGHQAAPQGGRKDPPRHSPFLRTTRAIEEDQVFTIEPGIYFIEMLLREHRAGDTKDLFGWDLIDRLTPFGGARVEDDVLVTADGHRNLTRPHLGA